MKLKFREQNETMLVTSSQSSSQRPLGLSVEEVYALDRQYRRLDQQHQHVPSTPTRLASSNLNRLTSRSLDLVSSSNSPLPVLPSLEIHGHGYQTRPQTPATSNLLSNYSRSNSIDQLRYQPTTVLPTSIFPSTLKSNYSPSNRAVQDNARYRTYLQVCSLIIQSCESAEKRKVTSLTASGSSRLFFPFSNFS